MTVVNEGDSAHEYRVTAEAVETLVWLAESKGIDRRRHRIVHRLRSVHDSEGFAALPEDLRARVREVIAEPAR